MDPLLEIIIPVRNPSPILADTVASLAAQIDRRFGVLLSDNCSTQGLEHLESAMNWMAAAGLLVRRVRPPFELKRVEHWNWAHSQARAEWVKPLFVGDFLKPEYSARVLQRLERKPAASLLRCEFESRSPGSTFVTQAPFQQDTLSAVEFLAWFPHLGNWLGGPINMCYRRLAWQAAGGYSCQLPACADLNLYVRLALEAGLETIHEPLAVFQLHDQRYSHGIVKRQVNGSFELWLILRQARNFCLNRQLPWPRHGVFRGVWRQLKIDYWHPWKQRLKSKSPARP